MYIYKNISCHTVITEEKRDHEVLWEVGLEDKSREGKCESYSDALEAIDKALHTLWDEQELEKAKNEGEADGKEAEQILETS